MTRDLKHLCSCRQVNEAGQRCRREGSRVRSCWEIRQPQSCALVHTLPRTHTHVRPYWRIDLHLYRQHAPNSLTSRSRHCNRSEEAQEDHHLPKSRDSLIHTLPRTHTCTRTLLRPAFPSLSPSCALSCFRPHILASMYARFISLDPLCLRAPCRSCLTSHVFTLTHTHYGLYFQACVTSYNDPCNRSFTHPSGLLSGCSFLVSLLHFVVRTLGRSLGRLHYSSTAHTPSRAYLLYCALPILRTSFAAYAFAFDPHRLLRSARPFELPAVRVHVDSRALAAVLRQSAPHSQKCWRTLAAAFSSAGFRLLLTPVWRTSRRAPRLRLSRASTAMC